MLEFKGLTKQQADRMLIDDFCTELLATKLVDLPPLTERNKLVEDVTEAYFKEYGKMPTSYILQMLADYLLLDHIRNKDTYKMDKVPILTERQMQTRRRKEAVIEGEQIDFFNAGNIWNFAKQRTTQEVSLNK